MTDKQTHGDKVRLKILEAGLKVWPDVTASSVARAGGFNSPNAVLYHFPRKTLKNAVAEHAVDTGCSKVIVQLIAHGHKATRKMTKEQRDKHFKAV